MADQAPSISPVKLGLAVAWPAFWTGVPIKIVISLLLLAMGLHPWEMPGLAFLLLLSIPIDIWAMNLSARTVFLERLRLDPPQGLGLTLWWQAVAFSAVYLPLVAFLEGAVIDLSKAMAATVMDWLKSVPVAERITIELTLWGVPSGIVLLALALGWLAIFGWLVLRQVAAARPAEGTYPALVRRWDLIRVPADLGLMLTVFTATGVLIIVWFWAAMPVTTPHPHPDYQKPEVKARPALKPAETLHKTERVIAQAEAAIDTLEAKAADGPRKTRDKGKGKPPESSSSKTGAPAQAQPAAAQAGSGHQAGTDHKDDGHKH